MNTLFTILRKVKRKVLNQPSIKSNSHPPIRRDLERIQIVPNLALLVYWKELKIGKGPAAVLEAFGSEIMKFDCFGKDKGHFHVKPHYDFRIFFVEETIEEQILRSRKEILTNFKRYLSMQSEDNIRHFVVSQEALETSTLTMEKKMKFFAHHIPELADVT